MKTAAPRYASNAATNVGGFLLETLGTVILVPYVIDRIGLASFGIVTAVISISLATQMFGQAVVAATIRHVARVGGPGGGSHDFRRELQATRVGLGILLVVGILGTSAVLASRRGILTWLKVPLDEYDIALRSLTFVAALLLPMVLSGYLTAILRGRGRFATANVIKVVATLVRVLGVFLVFETSGPGVFSFVVIRTTSFVLEGVLALVWLLRSMGTVSVPAATSAEKREEDRSMAAMVGGLLVFALGNILVIESTKLLVGRFHGLESVGLVGAAAMAISFLQRLVQAAAVAVNPAVSSLDAANSTSRADRLAYEAGSVTTALCGFGIVMTMPAWKVVGPIWLQQDLGGLWIVPGLLFAAQGSVSAIAPLVQAAYGRGRVIGLSLIHVTGNAIAVLIVYVLGKAGEGLLPVIVAIVGGRVLTAVMSAAYLGRRVFPGWSSTDSWRIILGIVLPWAGLLLTAWPAFVFDSGAVAVAAACLGAGAGAALAWRLILPATTREAIVDRLRRRSVA